MTTSKRNVASMPKRKPGFNRQGTINLEDFDLLQRKDYKDAEFLEYDFVDLDLFDTTSSQFWNLGVRAATGNRDDSIEDMRASFRTRGFMTTEFPPSVDTEGTILGGRTRIAAAKLNNEKFMPVAVYEREDSSERNTVTNGLRENNHPPSEPSKFHDFISGGIHLINKGEMERNKKAIRDWLYGEVDIEQWYDNAINGQVTKIIEKIMEKTETGTSIVLRKSRQEWETWVETNLSLPKADFELLSIDQISYVDRLWSQILETSRLKGNKFPTKVVLYTNSETSSKARLALKTSLSRLENHVQGTYALIEKMHGISFAGNFKLPYEILGAVPQIDGDHSLGGNDLVSVEEY